MLSTTNTLETISSILVTFICDDISVRRRLLSDPANERIWLSDKCVMYVLQRLCVFVWQQLILLRGVREIQTIYSYRFLPDLLGVGRDDSRLVLAAFKLGLVRVLSDG